MNPQHKPALRVAVLTGRIGELDPVAAGIAMAEGLQPLAQVALVPLGGGGLDLATAIGRLWGAQVHRSSPPAPGSGWWIRQAGRILLGWQQSAVPEWSPQSTSGDFGEWIRGTLAPSDEQVILDLTGVTAHDGGRGLIEVAAELLASRDLIGLVAPDELTLPATGIGGALALRAFAAGLDVAELVAADAALLDWAEQFGAGLAIAPGGGAAGGCGLAVLASGGRLEAATQFCHSEAGLAATLPVADLILTGCTQLSALDRGGVVVAAVSGWAQAAQRPCALLTPGPVLSARELRTFGIEVARQLPPGLSLAAGLQQAAARIAATWLSGSVGRT